jgi:hypothetical protein
LGTARWKPVPRGGFPTGGPVGPTGGPVGTLVPRRRADVSRLGATGGVARGATGAAGAARRELIRTDGCVEDVGGGECAFVTQNQCRERRLIPPPCLHHPLWVPEPRGRPSLSDRRGRSEAGARAGSACP